MVSIYSEFSLSYVVPLGASVSLTVRKVLHSDYVTDIPGIWMSQEDLLGVYVIGLSSSVRFQVVIFITALLPFSHDGVVTKVPMSCTISVTWFAVKIIQNKPRRRLQQTTQQRKFEQMMLQLVATCYSLGIEIACPRLVRGMYCCGYENGTLRQLPNSHLMVVVQELFQPAERHRSWKYHIRKAWALL